MYGVQGITTIKGNMQGWWYDTCASVNLSYDKAAFKTYFEVNDEQEVKMGNEV